MLRSVPRIWQDNGAQPAFQNGDGTASLTGGNGGSRGDDSKYLDHALLLYRACSRADIDSDLRLHLGEAGGIEGGLLTSAGGLGIGIQNDAGSDWVISLNTAAGGRQTFTTAVADATAGAWEIDWTQGGVIVDFNSSSIFNTATTDITSGTGATTTAWVIPTAGLAPGYVALGAGVDAVIGSGDL